MKRFRLSIPARRSTTGAWDNSSMRRDIVRVSLLLAAFVAFGVGFQYRYLILSRLNIQFGSEQSEQALGLRRIKDIPLPGAPTRFDFLSIDHERRLLFIANQGNEQVQVFSLARQILSGKVEGLGDVYGVLAVPDLRRVFATTLSSNQLIEIDEASLQVMKRSDAGEYPAAIAFVPDSNKLFISNEHGGTVTVLDATTGHWQAAIEVGGTVGDTVYDPFSRRIFSAAQSQNQIVETDSRRNTVVRRIELEGCGGPHGLYIDGMARLAFVGCFNNSQLAIVDLDSGQTLGTRSVGEEPDVLAFDEVLRRLYVAAESGFVTVFQERGRNLEPRGGAYLAPTAHTLAVDSFTHRIYMPLENVDGHPVLRVLAPLDVPLGD